MFNWYRETSARERKTLWACFGGWALDGMDVQLYSFLIPVLMSLWGMTRGEAGVLATSALVTSAIGGWVTGMLADRFGRVRMLQVTILWFALFTAASGFTNSFEQLLVVRALQGFGFGGEWAAGSVLIGEVIRAQYRGKAVGFVQSGWAPGWAAACGISYLALTYLPSDIAWRAIFLAGISPALLIFFLRRFVEEPEVFEQSRRKVASNEGSSNVFEIFAPHLIKTTILGSLLSTGSIGGYYAITTWLPSFLRGERGLTIFSSTGYLLVIILGSFCGYIASAYLSDAIGRRKNFWLFSVFCILTVFAYTRLPVSDVGMLSLGFPLGFFASGIFSGMGAFYTELFPTRVRASGQGFCYNMGRGLGAFIPTLVGWISASVPLSQAIGLFALGCYGLLVVTAFCLPETKGKVLTA